MIAHQVSDTVVNGLDPAKLHAGPSVRRGDAIAGNHVIRVSNTSMPDRRAGEGKMTFRRRLISYGVAKGGAGWLAYWQVAPE